MGGTRRRVGAASALVLGVLALARGRRAPTASSADCWRGCGDGPYTGANRYDVRAHNIQRRADGRRQRVKFKTGA